MADFYAPQNPRLAAFIQPYLSWRERQANESRLADLMLPKAIPDYLAGVAYGTNPREAPLTSWRSTLAYGLPAVEALGIAPVLRPAARGGLAAYGALERRLMPPAGQLNMGVGPGARAEFLNQADPAVRAMITDQLKLQGLRDVQITDGVIRDEIARRNAATMLGLPAENTAADRAAAMGFDADTYHFTNGRFSAFDPDKISLHSGDEGFLGQGFYSTTDKNVGQGWGTQVSMPLKVPDKSRNRQIEYRNINPIDKEENYRLAMGYPKEWAPADITAELVRQGKSGISLDMSPTGYAQREIMTISPADIRSRFAAFDPARAKEADILAGIAGLSLIPSLTLQDYFRQGQ